MTQNTLSRREALHILAGMGVLAAGAGTLLSACGKSEPAKKPADGKGADKPAAPKAAACNDVTGLSDADKATRTTLKYVDKSTVAGKNCANCALYVVPAAGKSCGTCSVVKGPIAAVGNCSVWAAKKPT